MPVIEHCTVTWRSFEEPPKRDCCILIKRKELTLRHASSCQYNTHENCVYSSDGECPLFHYTQVRATHLWCYPEDIKTED